jgi:hypothetical protein
VHLNNPTAATVALCLAVNGAIAVAQSPTGSNWTEIKRLADKAYFSETCRDEAATFDIRASDANTIIESVIALSRGALRPEPDRLDARVDCQLSLVLAINVLRLNGFDADLVFVSRTARPEPDKIDRVLVYVAALDRYVDPARSSGQQAALDRAVRHGSSRIHLSGPSVHPVGRFACRDLCLRVLVADGSALGAMPVQTESIRGQ